MRATRDGLETIVLLLQAALTIVTARESVSRDVVLATRVMEPTMLQVSPLFIEKTVIISIVWQFD